MGIIGIISDESSEMITLEVTTTTSIGETSSGTITLGTSTAITAAEVSSDTTAPETTATTAIIETTVTSDAYTATTAATDAQTTNDIIPTTTAAEAMTTFEIVGGGVDVNGAVLKGRSNGTTELMFNSAYQGFLGRAYTIDPTTGRVQDQGTGKYLCIYYAVTGRAEPATVSACVGNPDLDPGSSNLNCRVVRGRLSCQVPQVFFYVTGGDQVVALGKSGPNSSWEAVNLLARGVPGI